MVFTLYMVYRHIIQNVIYQLLLAHLTFIYNMNIKFYFFVFFCFLFFFSRLMYFMIMMTNLVYAKYNLWFFFVYPLIRRTKRKMFLWLTIWEIRGNFTNEKVFQFKPCSLWCAHGAYITFI